MSRAMVVVSEEALLAVVGRIYESIECPETWPETICAMGELIDGGHGFWGSGDNTWHLEGPTQIVVFDAGCYPTFFLSRADLRALDQYAEEFGELIIRFLKIIFLSILWSPKDVGAREAIGLRLTRRYLQAFEPSRVNSSTSSSKSAGRNLIAALWEDGRMFSDKSLNAMRLLIPHLDRALRLQMRLKAADLRAHLISGALDYLTLGVVLVDGAGVTLWHNRRAREIVSRSNSLGFSTGNLGGPCPSDTRSLRELVKKVVSGGSRGVLAISRGLDLRPLLVTALPLMRVDAPDALPTNAVVFISDPDRGDTPSVETLRQAFDLTYREAQTAIAVSRGHGLRAAANEMGVALTTARSQLQQAFAKTDTRHQAELAALVHRTLAHIRYN
jgi:DNA-binding CsgD family transcriptional regulator